MQALEQIIPTAFVGTLAADSRNVVELIETSYDVSVILVYCICIYNYCVLCVCVCVLL